MSIRMINIAFCGSLTLPAEDVTFQNTTETGKELITGTEYMQLTQRERQDYILESFATCVERHSSVVDFDQLDVTTEGDVDVTTEGDDSLKLSRDLFNFFFGMPPEHVTFQNITGKGKEFITGTEYIQLTGESREDYNVYFPGDSED
jgi:hypothetical protein